MYPCMKSQINKRRHRMHKALIIIGTLLVTLLLILGACGPAAETTSSASPSASAEFEVTSLDVTPQLITQRGETATITAEVRNIGGAEGTYAAVLTVNGANIETKQVALAAGASQTINFSLVEDTIGTYEIGIGGMSTTLTVQPVPGPTTVPSIGWRVVSAAEPPKSTITKYLNLKGAHSWGWLPSSLEGLLEVGISFDREVSEDELLLLWAGAKIFDGNGYNKPGGNSAAVSCSSATYTVGDKTYEFGPTVFFYFDVWYNPDYPDFGAPYTFWLWNSSSDGLSFDIVDLGSPFTEPFYSPEPPAAPTAASTTLAPPAPTPTPAEPWKVVYANGSDYDISYLVVGVDFGREVSEEELDALTEKASVVDGTEFRWTCYNATSCSSATYTIGDKVYQFGSIVFFYITVSYNPEYASMWAPFVFWFGDSSVDLGDPFVETIYAP